jgi:hypothetical protein
MQAWMGWTATWAPTGITAPTWDEWCAHQRRRLHGEEHRPVPVQESSPFSACELARLSFLRWLHQRGDLEPLDPLDMARNDNV